jgi:DNA-binding NarL/FixJ family response regulator
LHKVRLVVVQPLGILREVLTAALSTADEISVEEVLETGDDIFEALARTHPHFVIWGDGEVEISTAAPQLFKENPALKVLGVVSDGRRGYLWELLPQRFALGELSAELLVRTIREELEE